MIKIDNLASIKSQYQIPPELQTCHTAIVNGYAVEGHVPVEEINKLLSERPQVLGIGVPGMPAGSPGMEIDGFDTEPFQVVTFDEDGIQDIIASYPK